MERPLPADLAAVDAAGTGFYSRGMDRRRFLQWSWQLGAVAVGLGAAGIGLGAGAVRTTGKSADLQRPPRSADGFPRLCRTDQTGIAPGVHLDLQLRGVAPTGWSLFWQIEHGGRAFQLPAATAADASWLSAGHAALRCVIPYPFEDLVPGAYRLSLALHDADGSLVDAAAVGSYSLRRPRFSA